MSQSGAGPRRQALKQAKADELGITVEELTRREDVAREDRMKAARQLLKLLEQEVGHSKSAELLAENIRKYGEARLAAARPGRTDTVPDENTPVTAAEVFVEVFAAVAEKEAKALLALADNISAAVNRYWETLAYD